MKAVVAAFNQEKALVGAFSVITNRRIEFGWNFLKHYWSLPRPHLLQAAGAGGGQVRGEGDGGDTEEEASWRHGPAGAAQLCSAAIRRADWMMC